MWQVTSPTFACSALKSPRQRDPKHPSESQGVEPPPRYHWIFLKLVHSSRKGKSGAGNSVRQTAGWTSGTEPRCQGQRACRSGCWSHLRRGRCAFFPGASSQTPRPAGRNPCGSLSSLHQAPLPQPWPQHKGRCWEAWLRGVCSHFGSVPDLSLAAQHLHRSCQSPELTPGWMVLEGREKKTKNQTHAAVSASPSLERPSDKELEGAQG